MKTNMSQAELDKALRFEHLVRTGYDLETDRNISMKDAMDIPDAAIMIPRVMTQFVQEGVEPLLIGTSLLQRLQYTPGMQTVFPAIDVLSAREVGDNMALPIFNVNMAGGQSYGVTVKRHGLALRVNQKFISQSSWPWMSYWMKLSGQALARHKEEKIFNFITSQGTVAFDNSTAARTTGAAKQPVLGITTGRNIRGQYNGSTTMDDIFDMYSLLLMQGFIADTILVHPMTYLMWVKDPVLREFALVAGGGSFFGQFSGQANAKAYQGQYNAGGLGQGLGQTGQYTAGALTGGQTSTAQGLPQTQTSAPVLPSYLGIPFRILVSPFVYFEPRTKTTNFMMFDSKNLGAMVVAEDPHVKSWDEKMYDIQNIGVEETYGFAILNEAQGVAVAQNIRIKSNEFVLPARAVMNINESGSSFEGNAYDTGSTTIFGASPIDINSR